MSGLAQRPKDMETSDKPSGGHAVLLNGPPEIPREQIVIQERVGGGVFGDVFQATISGIKVAVKVPKKQDWDSEELRQFREEVAIMRSAFHTNVVLFLGACTQPGSIAIVMERMVCDLDKLLHHRECVPPVLGREPLSLARKIKIAQDAVLGVSWLHGILNLVHRDLKPANLMIDASGRVKVSDFGFSEIYSPERREIQMKGTALYAAPEIWRLHDCTKASDVYSIGIILWELYTEEEPFLEYTDVESFYAGVIEGGARPMIPPYQPRAVPPRCESPGPMSASFLAASQPPAMTLPSLRALIEQCWDDDPAKRPTVNDVRVALEFISIDNRIETESARTFWKRSFCNPREGNVREEVPFEQWAVAVARVVGSPLIEVRQLAELISVNGIMTAERFNNLQKWFGDFFVSPAGADTIDEIRALAMQPWFCGDVSKETADRWLNGREESVFLVRFSHTNSVNYPFTISKRRGSKNVHRRVRRLSYDPKEGARYSVDVQQSQSGFVASHSLVELIEACRMLGSVTMPCPREELADSNPYEAQRVLSPATEYSLRTSGVYQLPPSQELPQVVSTSRATRVMY
eukprot:m51a1_g141 putative sh2 domain-containing protein (577) ;mRNA; r:453669-456350